jgi:CheY-like chemotaxis protein
VVGEAANGQEALQWLAENPADVVVMDMRMPVMDGLTATRYLRRQGTPVKIIILSAAMASRDAALAAGADAFVNKIGSPYALLTALHRLVAELEKISTSVAEGYSND